MTGSVGAVREALHPLAVGIADALEIAGDRVDGRATRAMPDLRALREGAEAAMAGVQSVVHVQARLLLYRDLVGTVLLLTRDVDARAWTRDADRLAPALAPGSSRAAR